MHKPKFLKVLVAMAFLSFGPAVRRLGAASLPQVGRCFTQAAPSRSAWPRGAVRCFASGQKVAVIQDQQIPKEEALTALTKKGFDVSWSLTEPSDAWAIVTACYFGHRDYRKHRGVMSNLPAAVRMMAGRPQQQQGGSAPKRPRLEMPFANAVTAQSFAAAVAAFPRPALLPGVLPAAVPLPTAPAVPGPMGRAGAPRPRAVTSTGRMNPAANPAAVLPSAAAAAAAMLPPRDPAEVKQEGGLGGVRSRKGMTRTLLYMGHDFETHLKRAEKTKSIPRHPDPAIISCFKDGYSPGHEALVKMLESGIDPNTPSPGTGSGFAAGMTAILAAASWGKVDDIRLLIAAGADLKVRSPNIGHTAPWRMFWG
eukprot:s606_g15.t1